MTTKINKNNYRLYLEADCKHQNCRGIILLLTLVILVALSVVGYTLTSQVFAQRHRNQYIIDYQKARYACESALKFTLASLPDINSPQLIDRPNSPDFSDLFWLSEEDYRQLLEDWAQQLYLERAEKAEELDAEKPAESNVTIPDEVSTFLGAFAEETNEVIDVNKINLADKTPDLNDPNNLTIPGPYGPAWPMIIEPVNFEIGSAKVTIEIEDENAKFPIGWVLVDDPNLEFEAMAGFQTFCEWMGLDEQQIESLQSQFDDIMEIQSFKTEFKPIKIQKRVQLAARNVSQSGRRGSDRMRRYETKTITIPVAEQITNQTKIFANILHSSLNDNEILKKNTIESQTRKETPMKYTAIWGTYKVNINTAPRHVLEAVFNFGGDYEKIADEIIQKRKIKPFKNIDELKEELLQYADSIKKCENYIVTQSDCFTLKITAVSGNAEASIVAGLIKQGNEWKPVAFISG